MGGGESKTTYHTTTIYRPDPKTVQELKKQQERVKKLEEEAKKRKDPNYFKGDFSYRFNQRVMEKGVLLRPLGGTVYSVPPYCVTEEELEKIYKTIDEIVNEGVER